MLKDGKFEGRVKITYSNDLTMEGIFKDGTFDDHCKLTYPDGIVEEAMYRMGFKMQTINKYKLQSFENKTKEDILLSINQMFSQDPQ